METDTYGKLEFQEKALVEEILGKELQKSRMHRLISHAFANAIWKQKACIGIGEDGKTLVDDPINEYEPADALMNRFVQQAQYGHP